MRIFVNGKSCGVGASQAAQLSGLDVLFGQFRKEDRIPPHQHSFGCFCVMLEGQMAEVRKAERLLEFGPATAIYRPPDHTHANYFARSGALVEGHD